MVSVGRVRGVFRRHVMPGKYRTWRLTRRRRAFINVFITGHMHIPGQLRTEAKKAFMGGVAVIGW